MHSLDETGKPRYRAACDACRQSKVRCSGGGVCVRCKKHDYKCRYSIAHRAGKPKGSKNKATLKKLENLQAVQQGKLALSSGMGVPVSTGKISRLTNPGFPQQRKRRKSVLTHDFRARYDLGHPSQVHMRHASHPMSRKYAFPSAAFPIYPSPISPGTEPHLWQGIVPSTDMGFYNPVEPIYGHIASPAIVPYLPSPSEEPATAFSVRPEQPTVACVCNCMDRLDSSQRQLSSLDADFTLWRFDPTMELVMASLSSCHIFLGCVSCPKSVGGQLWILISLLDRTFDVLNHLVLHRTNRNDHELWSEQQQQYGQVIPYSYPIALQDCILEQSIATSYQIVRALRDTIDTESGITGSVLGDINMNNSGLSSSSSSPTGFPSPASTEAPVQEFILKSDQVQQTCNPECSAFKIDKAKSCNTLSSSDISFLLQAVHHYETIISSMQAVVTRNAAAAATTHASSASWSIGISDTATSQCGPYQPAAMECFPQHPHPEHARYTSYNVIGLS